MRLVNAIVIGLTSSLGLFACGSHAQIAQSPPSPKAGSGACPAGEQWDSKKSRCRTPESIADDKRPACGSGEYWDSVVKSCIRWRSTPGAAEPWPPARTPLARPACGPGEYWDSLESSCRRIGSARPTAEPSRPTISPARPVEPTPDPQVRRENPVVHLGTAFAVRPDGVFLTAAHVVKDAQS